MGLLKVLPKWFAKGMYLCGAGSIAFTLMGSLVFVMLSTNNYPGGVALEGLKLHLESCMETEQIHAQKWEDIHVHIDVAAAMTGVSLFGQRHASYRYLNEEVGAYGSPFRIDKSGYEEENTIKGTYEAHTHLLTERQSVEGYHTIDAIPGYPRLDVRNFRIATQDAIYILERDGWQ